MYEEEGQQQGDGLDDEIGRLAPSLELFRDWPMYSPQRSPTEWCADQVLEFSVQWEWASVPMCSPQRSPTLWCFDREQFPDPPHQRESTSYSRFHIAISSDELRKHFGLKRKDAAEILGVSFLTLKRFCRKHGISRWPMPSRERKLNGCSVVEQRLLNNSDHQNSPGSEPLEVVRPLQQRNDGVVIRDNNDEQNVSLIPINEVQPLQDISNRFVFGNELDQNVIHVHEETERVEAMARKRKATYVGEGKENTRETERIEAMARKRKATYVGEGNENSQVRPLQQRNDGVVIRDDIDEQNVNLIPINEVQPLREINIGVVFGNELDQNVIHIHEETETIEAMARKQKATYVGEGNENSQGRPLQQRNDGVVVCDDTDEQNVNLIPINEVQRLQNFGNELDQNVIHINEETERIEAMARKGKATYNVGEGNENSQGYSLEEGRNVEVNSLMDKKLYSGVQDIQLFQPSWPEVEIMQEESSEQQILGELGPKNIEHKAVQKKEKDRSKKNIGHKVASAEKSCKKKNTTETPTKKYWTKRFISLEDLLQHVGRKRADAAKALGVSVPTFKRCCRKYGITCWNGDGCPRIEPELLNNSVHQSSPGSIPAEIRGEKETSALLRAKQDDVTIKANYEESILKFQLSLESGVRELNKEVAKRSLLELGSFKVEYLDEDEEPILIACDEDFQACVEFFSRSSSNEVIRLLVNKVSNSEKSHQSCSGLKRKKASTSSSRVACTLRERGRGRGRGREGGAERKREEVDYIQYLPEPFQRYMSYTKNVKADGHCGFRAIAAQIYDTEEDWAKVRHDLIHEIRQNKDLYDVLYREHNWADKLLQSLSYFLPAALEPNWMDCMSLGVVIASRYNIVLYTFDANVGCCYTHLPLRSPPVPVKQRKEIAIARIDNHFMQLFLHPHHPVPPVPIWWWERASDEAKGWALSYDLTLWFHVLGIVPGSQVGGNID